MVAELVVVGLSHRSAPLDVRERAAFSEDEQAAALAELLELPAVGESMLLSTCNRVEIVAAADDARRAVADVSGFLARRAGIDLAPHLYDRVGPAAVKHVFRVAASLDSLVVGEPQILGQLKEAYQTAVGAGSVGPLLGRCLERAFGVAKRVRSETDIARGAANVSSVAVELAKRVFGRLDGKTVLVVGAGKMSDLAARHLRDDGVAAIRVANRTPERARELAVRIDGAAVAWESLDDELVLADVVITSTGSRQPILTRARLKPVTRARRYRPLFIVDIAVPRDVEPEVGKLEGVYLFDIDDLEEVVVQNRKGRDAEAQSAERIVEAETAQFLSWLRAQGVVPTIKDLRERFLGVAAAEAERTLGVLGARLDAGGQAAVRQMAEAIVAKLLHTPLMALKTEEEADDLVAAARRLFALEGGDKKR
ncbi:MAG TPA: glutamyl-tRNA reductase [Haliangiales bacterium]|nr:glutamyl-tRNA reductase [Haliangiales bacterium]